MGLCTRQSALRSSISTTSAGQPAIFTTIPRDFLLVACLRSLRRGRLPFTSRPWQLVTHPDPCGTVRKWLLRCPAVPRFGYHA